MRLKAEGLAKVYPLPSGGTVDILSDASLTVETGEIVAVQGASGSGKSTLLALLGLLDTPDAGEISIDDACVNRLPDNRRSDLRAKKLGFVFQNYSLLPHLSARENVELPLMHGPRMARSQARAAVLDCLDAVGLAGRADARPRQLSGGEQQRVAIARALVRGPAVVLADEPTGALDTGTADRVLDLLCSVATEAGAALLLVTHDPNVARRADRALFLRDGVLERTSCA
ncbi:ABC transporter ATP-binding protein [Nonomuraea longispora]|uniref:ABC transporter ATP-binding protein n=1 Tax=Nonomuraea longispora TaxID=1848320 RepID=A0A4R4NND0_9ACTN|nr:ABC transporter ATP-binding protein [Nonomuraea longispora]TDC10998.1 ABC transporter ATP-binding protein [Nonomuraea longispora]